MCDPQTMRKIITLLLVIALCFFGYQKAKAFIPQCIIGIVVIGAGIVLVMGLRKMCKSIPPLENPPQPPPASTNAPQHRMTFTSTTPLPRINLNDDNVEAYDVSAFTFDTTDPYGNPYNRLFRTTIQSSVDLKTWNTELSLVGWMSGQYVIIVYYDKDGLSIATNGATLTFGSGTNETYVPIDTRPPVKFFK